jgi:hypothetical protein
MHTSEFLVVIWVVNSVLDRTLFEFVHSHTINTSDIKRMLFGSTPLLIRILSFVNKPEKKRSTRRPVMIIRSILFLSYKMKFRRDPPECHYVNLAMPVQSRHGCSSRMDHIELLARL